MGIEPTHPLLEAMKDRLADDKLAYAGGHKTDENGRRIWEFTKDGTKLTFYQVWHHVRYNRWPSRKDTPKGLTISDNPDDWIPTYEEFMTELAAREAKKTCGKGGRKCS